MQHIHHLLSDRWRRSHRAARDESGQALILLVFILTVMFVMGAIVFDAGLALSEKERLQTATDAAALAGAQSKAAGASDAGAQLAACNRFKDNGYDSSSCQTDCTPSSGENCVNIPPLYGAHVGNAAYVEVIGSHDSLATFLSEVSSSDKFTPEARSVAGYTSGGAGYGIFAYVTNPDTTCTPPHANPPALQKDVDISASNSNPIVFDGPFHTNGSVFLGGSAPFITFTSSVTYGCQIGQTPCCVPPGATQLPGTEPYPPSLALTMSQAGYWVSTDLQDACASNASDVYHLTSGNVASSPHHHPPPTNSNLLGTLDAGIYCFTGVITIPGTVSGNVTFVALGTGGVVMGGGGCTNNGTCSNLTAYRDDILMYAEGTGVAVRPTGGTNTNRVVYTGVLAAPNGKLEPNGTLMSFYGGWAANTIHITAGNIDIHANGMLGGGGFRTNLVE